MSSDTALATRVATAPSQDCLLDWHLACSPGGWRVLITDGEPTAHVMANGEPFFSYPPVPETIELTLKEVMRCTRDGIRINTFMLDATSYLTNFVEKISQLNGGRAFFTTNQTLGDYVLVDFVEQKRKMIRGR